MVTPGWFAIIQGKRQVRRSRFWVSLDRELMSSIKQQSVVKGMRWAARIIGLPVTFFGLVMGVGEAVQSFLREGFGPINLVFLGGSLIVLSMVVAAAGCIISWWRVRLGGALLVSTFFMLIAAGILAGGPIDYPERFSLPFIIANVGKASIMGSPFLVAGVLFVIAGWLSTKASSSALSASTLSPNTSPSQS